MPAPATAAPGAGSTATLEPGAGTVSAPLGDADWPAIKPFLSGSP